MTQAFNLSQLGNNINSSGQVSMTAGVTGTLPIANGGTNATATPTLGGVIVGTGTAYSSTAAGTSGYFLQSNGSAAPTWNIAGGGLGGMQVFTTSGTFTIPAGKTVVKITVVGGGGGGGGGGSSGNLGFGGGGGGAAISVLTGLTPGNTLTVTRGAAGTGATTYVDGGTGGTSTVASGTQTITTISATGGGGGPRASGGCGYGGSAGVGGLGSNGQANLKGSPGGGQGVGGDSGTGGSSIFGGGGASQLISAGGPGNAGVNGGGGGGGVDGGNIIAGAGGVGIIIFEY
jgi:hypothetical protein